MQKIQAYLHTPTYLLCLLISLAIGVLCLCPCVALALNDEVESDTGVYLKAIENPFQVTDENKATTELLSGNSFTLKSSITYSKAYKGIVTYSWRYSTDNGNTWIDLDCNSDTLTITQANAGSYLYEVTARDNIGNSCSETFKVSVAPAPQSSNGDNNTANNTMLSKTGDSLPIALVVVLGGVAFVTIFVSRKLAFKDGE